VSWGASPSCPQAGNRDRQRLRKRLEVGVVDWLCADERNSVPSVQNWVFDRRTLPSAFPATLHPGTRAYELGFRLLKTTP
jgi:hypothetical protein